MFQLSHLTQKKEKKGQIVWQEIVLFFFFFCLFLFVFFLAIVHDKSPGIFLSMRTS